MHHTLAKGFTLIELALVLALVAIIASLSYPTYSDYITRARRMDGHFALLHLASQMEHYYFNNHTYQTATIAAGNDDTDVADTAFSAEGWYVLSIKKQTDSTYTLQATPHGTQGKNDKSCQSLTLDNLGTKGIIAGPRGLPTGTVQACS